MRQKEVQLDYYASIPVERIFRGLKTSAFGLPILESKKRLAEFGPNVLAEKKEIGIIAEFFLHFKNPLALILLIAAFVSFFFGEMVNAVIIIILILLSVILQFFQEHNAGKATKELEEYVRTRASVIRDGKVHDISIEDVCVGDIILLNPGSLVPADARIIQSKELFVDQSSLTGESIPAEKTHQRIKHSKKSLTELANMVFLGTSIVSGSGTAVVVKTGLATELGRMSKQLASAPVQTEFEKGVTSFGYLITKTVLFLVLFIFFLNSLVKHNILESLMFSLAIAVGLTPELLPMIMSINMAKGSLNMAKKGAIIKKLSSIPDFGSMDVLCTDKTGTLTEDRIRLVKYIDISGNNSDSVLLHAYLTSHYHTGVANPLDLAIRSFKKASVSGYEKIDEIPFDFVRKMMSVVVEKNSRKRFLITKGAPEEVLESCSLYELNGKTSKLTGKIRSKITKQYSDISRQGYRVLAVAVKSIRRKKKNYCKNDESEMKFLGFAVFLDPPKKDVRNIIREMHQMGIEVKVLTGDDELVTKKICDEVGLNVRGILVGSEIDKLNDSSLKIKVENTTIFARCSPNQKNRIILALKSNGHVTGYLGDGINDALSLKTADVGISVNSAVDIAKESADIVLTHKSLEALKNGVLEGRKTFGNTMKYVTMGLSSNFGNMFSVLGAVLYLPFLPMLPMQILLNNFIYDASQVTIPTDHVDHDLIKKPKKWDLHFLRMFMIVFGLISSVFDLITFYILFALFHTPEAVFQTGWFMESLATQTLVIFIIRTKQVPFFKSKASKYLLISTMACVAAGWIIPYTKIGVFFGFAPLPLYIALTLIGLVVVYLVLVEIAKWFFYKKYDL